jgi:predicted acylesterase/phospholipase RssA
MINMKSRLTWLPLLLLVFLHPVIHLGFGQDTLKREIKPVVLNPKEIRGTAVVITGAASRIPQEVALLEHLYYFGWLDDVVFISGDSAGALNAVMLNAILSGGFSWEQYKSILFTITNDQVYQKGERRFPYSTDPLRQLLTRVVRDSLGYSLVGDLPIPSSISTTFLRWVPFKMKAMRFSNQLINEESDPGYDLIDLLMASTAIPLVFPAINFRDSTDFKQANFIDGGVAEDQIPYEAVIQYIEKGGVEPERMIIVSRKLDTEMDFGQMVDAAGLKNRKVYDRLGDYLVNYSKRNFEQKLMELQEVNPGLAARTYIYLPDFEQNFSLLDFDSMKVQYDLTREWAGKNQPILLADYLKQNPVEEK